MSTDTLPLPRWRHPLHGINLSRRMKASLLCQPIAPMATAVRLRSELLELGYHVLLMSPSRMLIATPERPNRFEEYDIAQGERLLRRLLDEEPVL